MEYRRIAQTLADFFTRGGYPFAVVGGLALHGYGLSHTTFDLDFATDAAQEPLVAYLESLGYETLYRSRGVQSRAASLTRHFHWSWWSVPSEDAHEA